VSAEPGGRVREDGRQYAELRPVRLELSYLSHAEGSCLATAGNTRVLCAASVERRVPPFLVGSGQGWVTAEYGLLPRSTHQRTPRETERPRARSQEIKRFLGRSLRAVCDLSVLGEVQVIVDCDVIQADGGTRTLALTGGFCALKQAVDGLVAKGQLRRSPLIEHVAAVSVGVVDGEVMLDLAYSEDARADTDMNLVLTESGRIVEVQATAEHIPFTLSQWQQMYDTAARAIRELIGVQHSLFSA
jgi:ribonuclease PH